MRKFLVSTAVAENALPDVLYRPGSGHYIIVWQQGGDVYSRGVLPDGTLAGGATAVANTSQLETNARLTADLLIYQRQNSGSGYDLYARPLDANGQPNGEPFTIQETAGNQQNPAMAAGSNQRYQLAWQDDATGPWDLFTAVLDRRYQVTHIEYEYDPLYRLTKAEYSGDISAGYTYTYDAVGNMTAYEETIGTATTSVNRTFNAANQLLVSVDSEAGSSTFTYDNNGNLERINLPGFADEKLLYAYNQRNLLTLVSRQFGYTAPQEEAAFIYDGDGNRLQQVDYTGSQPATTTYTNDIIGLSQVLVSDDGTTTTYNLFGLDLISQDDGSQTRTLLTDGLGSTRVEMVGGAVETTATYEPYGKVLAQTGESVTVYGFTGEQHDALTGLVYLRARYYNPSLKLFMSRDPFPGYVTLSISQNGYAYVHANPVNRIDPSGLCIPMDDGRCYRDNTRISRDLIDFQGANGQHWTASEKWQVNRAAWHIASRLAQTYNAYMHNFKISPYLVDNETFRFYCGENGRPLRSREAFLYYYGGQAQFYKTGEVKTFYGQYVSLPRPRINVYKYNLNGTVGYYFDRPDFGYRWATHELGHYFEARINRIMGDNYVRDKVLGKDERISRRGLDNHEVSYGFAGTRWGWQQSPEATTGEEFADMFLGWNYNLWAPETDVDYYADGQARANFMDRHMAFWIALVINRERQKTR